MCGGGGSAPTPPPRTLEAPVAPGVRTGGSTADADARRRRAAGSTGTILTGPSGTTGAAATATKTLLGQ